MLAGHLLGWTTIGYVEIDKYCQQVIAQRIKDEIFKEAPIFTDVREFIQSGAVDEYEGVTDVLSSAFPVNHSVSRAREKERTIPETCGQKPSRLFAEYDHDSRSWRTCQVSLLTNLYDEYSETWPKQGMMQGGVCSEQMMWVPHTIEKDSGYWPTPSSNMSECSHPDREMVGNQTIDKNGIRWGASLLDCVIRAEQMFPTPTAWDWKDANHPSEQKRHTPGLATHAGGQLNPMWVEWLMGWPLGQTDLKPLEMAKYRLWLQQHGKS